MMSENDSVAYTRYSGKGERRQKEGKKGSMASYYRRLNPDRYIRRM